MDHSLSDEERNTKLSELRDGRISMYFRFLDKTLERTNTAFIAGDELTIADICISALLYTNIINEMNPMGAILKPDLEQFPRFNAYLANLKKELADVYANRAPAPY